VQTTSKLLMPVVLVALVVLVVLVVAEPPVSLD
jgi:hypothetical protein